MVACRRTVRPCGRRVQVPPLAVIAVCRVAPDVVQVVSPLVPSTSAPNVVDSDWAVPPISRLKSGVVVVP